MSRQDPDREAVYSAEDEADERTVLAQPLAMTTAVETIRAVTASVWWRSVLGARSAALVVGPADGTSHWNRSGRLLRLSLDQVNLGTICHELAHVVVSDTIRRGVAQHGRAFRSAHVQVRTGVLGSQCGFDLHTAYERFGLDAGAPSANVVPILDAALYTGTRTSGRTGARSPGSGSRPIAL